jgi:TM2 domain-containing membrane protein YozV
VYCSHCNKDMISFRFCPVCGNPPGPQSNTNQSDMTQAYDPSQTSPLPNVFPQNNLYNNNYQNNPYPNNSPSPYNDKSEFLAVILSFFIMGVGQMYTGRIARGIGILVLSIFLGIIFGILVFATMTSNSYAYSNYNQNTSELVIFTIIFGIGLFILWVWQMSNAHSLCHKYNQHLLQYGRPPW